MKNLTKQNLLEYCLRLGDTNLVLSQRLGEWCGHGPILEEDIALTNIALDLLGQARAFYTYAGEIEGQVHDEDYYAFLRDERQFRNTLLAEQPNGDFGQTMLRQFLISTFQYYFYTELKKSSDKRFSELAEKFLKEVTYHVRHSSEWIIRLGDSTGEAHQRMIRATDELWRFTGDLFDMDETELSLIKEKIGVDLVPVESLWNEKVKEVFLTATLPVPENIFMMKGSRQGSHTEALGHLLSEMQYLPRMFPGATW